MAVCARRTKISGSSEVYVSSSGAPILRNTYTAVVDCVHSHCGISLSIHCALCDERVCVGLCISHSSKGEVYCLGMRVGPHTKCLGVSYSSAILLFAV